MSPCLKSKIRTSIIFFGMFAIGFLSISFESRVSAQELRKAINDYRNERPFQYQPSDPWVRSKLFQAHTKHRGFFYNCDNEECKRQSPYICWKLHFENDLPTRMTWKQRIRHELGQVRQRIYDGAGMCAEGCGCSEGNQSVSSGQCSDCQMISQKTGPASETEVVTTSPKKRVPFADRFVIKEEQSVDKRFGLLSAEPTPQANKQVVATPMLKANSSTTQGKPVPRVSEVRSVTPPPANRSLLEQIRKIRR